MSVEQVSDDDFQNPAPYQQLITSAIADISGLRNFTRPQKRAAKNKQKPGPKPKVVRLKFYLLPDGSELPKFSKQDPAIERHQSIGYGFPSVYYHDFKGKAHPISLDLAEDAFKDKIRSLYNRLADKDFSLFTISPQRSQTPAPFSPQYFKDIKYQGTVIIKIKDTNGIQSGVPTAVSTATITQPSATTTQIDAPVSTPTAVTQPSAAQRTVPLPPLTPPSLRTEPTTPLSHPVPTDDGWIPLGTPEVTANPRTRLVMEQDIDFAASLAMDQDKEASRQQSRLRRILQRTERQRQRDIRKGELEKMQMEAVDKVIELRQQSEEEDLISIVLVLPDQQEMRKTFSKQTKSETLHLYIEAVTDVATAKLVYCGQVVNRQPTSIMSMGINASCRIIVEDEYVEDSSDDNTEQDETPAVQPNNMLEITSITDLEHRRSNVLGALLPPVQITVNRETIVDDLMDHYRLQPDLVHHRLEVTFSGEEAALDLDGVTREMFSCFFVAVMLKFFVGNMHKVPAVDHRFLFNGTFEVIGKILSHAYILCNYLPPALSPIVYIMTGTGFVSDDLVLMSFMMYISENECNILKQLFSATNFNALKDQMVNLMATYNGREVPTPDTIRHLTTQIARTTLLVTPLYPISCLKKGMDCYPLLWQGVSEKLVTDMLEKFRPTPEKVIDLIVYNTADESTLNMLEERVKSYLERYILSLSPKNLSELLRFWTSTDTLCLHKLDVSFNSTDGIRRRPIANTCSATLQISRLYFSPEDLAQDFDLYLNHHSARTFDSV